MFGDASHVLALPWLSVVEAAVQVSPISHVLTLEAVTVIRQCCEATITRARFGSVPVHAPFEGQVSVPSTHVSAITENFNRTSQKTVGS